MSSAAGLINREPTHSALRRDEIMDARGGRRVHPAGRPVSRSTYVNQGCRCDGCKDANAAYNSARKGSTHRPRRVRALVKVRNAERQARENQAIYRARATLARIHPEQYRILLALARTEVDIERGPLPGDGS